MKFNKRGVSAIVGYVLLISMTLAISVTVYNWLKFYVSESEAEECPNDVSIIISEYNCRNKVIGGDSGSINVTLKNKGLFTVDGYVLRVHDKSDAEFGLYTLTDTGGELSPGESETVSFSYENVTNYDLEIVRLLEVQPFMIGENGRIMCENHITQKTECENN